MKTADHLIEVAYRAGSWSTHLHTVTLAEATRTAASFARQTVRYRNHGPCVDARLRAALRVIRIRHTLTGEIWTPQFPAGAIRIKWVSSK